MMVPKQLVGGSDQQRAAEQAGGCDESCWFLQLDDLLCD